MSDYELLALDEIENLARQAFLANGCDAANADALTRTVVAAERDGSKSHGLFRVPGYVASLRSGKVNGRADPNPVKVTPAFIRVDGDRGYTPLAIERGVPALAEAAAEAGIAAMTIASTYHFAALWHEVESIAARGLVGVACVSSPAVVAPFGGAEPIFGTNPIAFAWPRPGQRPVVYDMATAAMAQGEVQIAARDGRTVSAGTGLDAQGEPTDDPQAILDGVQLPFGGHKGSAMALMVELLAAGATGESFSFEASDDVADGGPSRGGEFFIAISPTVLAGPDWADRCEVFFERFAAIEGARLPGSKRHRLRDSDGPRPINRDVLTRVRELC